jgi:hypothetical protein
MIRRSFLKRLAAAAAPSPAGAGATKLKIMIKSAWGSDDPTKAAFPFLHGDALSEAGHEVQNLSPGRSRFADAKISG